MQVLIEGMPIQPREGAHVDIHLTLAEAKDLWWFAVRLSSEREYMDDALLVWAVDGKPAPPFIPGPIRLVREETQDEAQDR